MAPTAATTALRAALWLLLGGWVGAWLLFGLVVAPTAFRVLPSTRMAGTLVGPVLTALHLFGAVAGPLLAGIARALHRPAWTVALPALMGLTCLASQLGISAAIEGIRDLAFGPGGSPEIAARFRTLHQLSMTLFVAVGLAALALAWGHARSDALAAGSSRGVG